MKQMSRCLVLAVLPVVVLLGVTVAGPANADVSGLKPVASGVMNRSGPATGLQASTINSFVISVNWSDVQPTQDPGTDHGGDLDTSAIDAALATVAAGQTVRLRVFAGVNAPEWAKSLDGPEINWYDPTSGALVGTIGRFWLPRFAHAYDDLQAKLAAKYDNDARLQEVVVDRCTTQFAEPFVRQAGSQANLTNLQAAGYTVAADHQCQLDELVTHARVWLHTRSSVAFNPFQLINEATYLKTDVTTDEGYTESVMVACRQILGLRCVLGNNSLSSTIGTTPTDPYTNLYNEIRTLGPPAYFQTSTNAKIGDWRAALQRAVDLGAESVELPVGSASWPVDDSGGVFGLAHYDTLLEGNAATIDAVLPPDLTPPSTPANVQSTTVTGSSVDLTWDASSDDVAVTGYNVYRDGVLLGMSTDPGFVDDSVVDATSYRYTITALDAAANESTPSTEVDVTTPDTDPPSVPTGLQATAVSGSTVSLQWDASDDNVGVTGYDVYRDGTLLGPTTDPVFSDDSVSDATTYSYTVTALDAAGHESAPSTPLTVSTPDASPPDAPAGLQQTAISGSSVSLAWLPSADNVAVTGYRVYRDGTMVGSVTDPAFTDDAVDDATRYSYAVTAVDAAGNESTPSAALVVTTPDVTPPGSPAGLHVTTVTGSSVSVAWLVPGDNVGVTGYRIYRGGALIGSSSGPTYTDTSVVNGTPYTYTVTALDAAGNESSPSTTVDVTTPDTAAPSVPTQLQATAPSGTQVNLTWTASTDNVGVAGYHVYRGGSLVGSTSTATFADHSVVNGTTYAYAVTAVDAAGNESGSSTPVNVTTPDTAAPTTPSHLQATTPSATQVNLSWTPSTDNVGVAHYTILRGSTPVGTSVTPSFVDKGVKAKTTYTYTVAAVDQAGNTSPASAALTVTTPAADTQPPTAPSGLKATATTGKVTLTWKASTDNVRVTGYRVYRGSGLLATTTALSLLDSTVRKGTTYTYDVVALDAAGNVSQTSVKVKITAK